MTVNKKVLLIGGDGTLGSSIVKLKIFKDLEAPPKKKLNLLKRISIKKSLKEGYHLIINCAAIARMKECEKNPFKAVRVNILGTSNLIKEIIDNDVINVFRKFLLNIFI